MTTLTVSVRSSSILVLRILEDTSDFGDLRLSALRNGDMRQFMDWGCGEARLRRHEGNDWLG